MTVQVLHALVAQDYQASTMSACLDEFAVEHGLVLTLIDMLRNLQPKQHQGTEQQHDIATTSENVTQVLTHCTSVLCTSNARSHTKPPEMA